MPTTDRNSPMPRGRKVQPPPKQDSAQAELPNTAPRRKHPLLLALVTVVLVGWVGFMVWLAVGG